MIRRGRLFASALVTTAALAACGGGDDAPAPAPVPAPAPTPPPALTPPPLATDAPIRVSAATPFNATCAAGTAGETVYLNAEVEPYVAVNPRDPANWVVTWQQDRWSGGSANGVVAAATFDGGATWTRTTLPFSRCGGGTAGNGGDYQRATDPWVSFAPDGTVYQMALAVSGASFTPDSSNAMLVARSTDGGRTWGRISTLIRDGALHFNDKNSITADPTDARFVYAVWDRLAPDGSGPTMLARSNDGGITWEAARAIYDPGPRSQTIGNVIVVLPNGTVVDVFTQLDPAANGTARATLQAVVSSDKGGSWSGPFRIADALGVGARDPETSVPIRDGANLPQVAVAPNGHLWVAWQDARFAAGAYDGIALARSTDGGRTWSAPVQVNSAPSVPAFTPSVHVAADGVIGVTYFDLRSNTADAGSLPTELILARSRDGVRWTEHRVSPTFDLVTAPVARGYFLGDYHGLASANGVFLPVYVRTTGDSANRTDVFAVPARSLAPPAASDAMARIARAAAPFEPDAAFRRRVHGQIVRTMDERVPGWSARRAATPGR
jgi:hypothetical protein